MFQSICLRHIHKDIESLDLGRLAEALLFYKNVHLIAHYGTLELLLRHCGPELLFDYIDEGFLTIHYVGSSPSIKVLNEGTSKEKYQPNSIRIAELWQLQDAAPILFQSVLGNSEQARKLGNQFAGRIHSIVPKRDMMDATREDFRRKEYVKEAVIQLLNLLVPEYQIPKYFRFNIKSSGDVKNLNTFLTVNTNLDFVSSNNHLQLRTLSGLKPISPAMLLAILFDARWDLYFASQFESEIATTDLLSVVIKAKCADLLSTRIRNETNLELFQDQFLTNGHAIREAINSGKHDYKDLIKLLREGRKWKDWLYKQEPGADIINTYYKEMTHSTWVEKLSAKILRWSILTGIGASLLSAPPLASIGIPGVLSAFDSFLLEKLVRGWRPDQFVEGPLKKFTSKH